MFALVVASMFAFQEPAPEAGRQRQEPEVAPPAARSVEAWDDKTAKAKVKEFERQFKQKPSMSERKRLIDELSQGQNKLLVKPLAKVVETDASVVIRKHAVEMLLSQPPDDVAPVLQKLLADGKVTANAQVQASLIRGIGRFCYKPKQWARLADVFEDDYDTERVPVHEAILELVIQHKEQQALPLLLRNLDEPIPEDVDVGSNPPAEYWKARWHSWAAWKGKVKEALFAITGQQFTTAAEAKQWLDKNPLPKKDDGGGDGDKKRRGR